MEFSVTEATRNSILRQLDRMFPYDLFPGYNIRNGLVLAFTPESSHLRQELSDILRESRLPFMQVQNEDESPEDCFARGYEQFVQNRLGYIVPVDALCCLVLVGGSAPLPETPTDPAIRRFHLMPPELSMPETLPENTVTLQMMASENPARQLANLLFTLLLQPDNLQSQNGRAVRASFHQAGKQYLALRMRNLLYVYLEKSTTDEELELQIRKLVSTAYPGIPHIPAFSSQPVSGDNYRHILHDFPKPLLGFLAQKKALRLEDLATALYGEDAAERLLKDYRLMAEKPVRTTAAALWEKKQSELLGEGSSNLDTRLFRVLQGMIARQEENLQKATTALTEALDMRRTVGYKEIMDSEHLFSEVDKHFGEAASAQEALLLLHAFSFLASKENNRDFWTRRTNGILSLQNWHNFLSNYLIPGLQNQRITDAGDVTISWDMSPEQICRSCFNIADRWSSDAITRIYRSAPMPAGHVVKSAFLVCDEVFGQSDSGDAPLNPETMTHDASGQHPVLRYVDGFGPANTLFVWFCA